ncbi:Cytochrome oxidase biogenesis protein Surf1, facilitates heme A insertion [plant metagenome]|uniref:Cytochrome oxidase biogenesis protein Surf1, facilitates heme A insertion n=1 Tax=plant metagenome TaxID=1297885 RepID=A0A484R0F7_9ZZZZ
MAANSSRRVIAALILLALVVAATVSLGRWQLRRADERRAVAAAIEAGRVQPPLALSAGMAAEQLQPWSPARATGVWRHDLTVLLDNRNQEGRPGFWVATPLMLDAERGDAVLVLRGWLARPLGDTAMPALPAPTGRLTVDGELAAHVPRLFELDRQAGRLPAGWPQGGDAAPPRVQNLALPDLAAATGLHLVPAVLMQTAGDGDGLLREWPQPSIDADKNTGYALQWFGFATIAGIAWLVVAAGAWRRGLR